MAMQQALHAVAMADSEIPTVKAKATWDDKVLMCFPRYLRYPKGVPKELIKVATEIPSLPPAAQVQRKKELLADLKPFLLKGNNVSPDSDDVKSLSSSAKMPLKMEGGGLDLREVKVDPTQHLPFPSMMECYSMRPSRKKYNADGQFL